MSAKIEVLEWAGYGDSEIFMVLRWSDWSTFSIDERRKDNQSIVLRVGTRGARA